MSRKLISKENLLDILTKKGFIVSDASDFYGEKTNGIWFKTATTDEVKSELFAELSWDNEFQDVFPITDFIHQYGWYTEPYDSETLMAFPI